MPTHCRAPALRPPPRAAASSRERQRHKRLCGRASTRLYPPTPHPQPTHSEDDTVGDLKKLAAAQTGTRPDKLRIQKWHNVFKVRCVCVVVVGVVWRVTKARCFDQTPPFPLSTHTPQDHITLADYEIHDGMGLELYYN